MYSDDLELTLLSPDVGAEMVEAICTLVGPVCGRVGGGWDRAGTQRQLP